MKVVAVWVSGKEAYGGQKQALNISLTRKTMNTEESRILYLSPNKALAADGFLLFLYRIAFVVEDFPSSVVVVVVAVVVVDLPRLAQTCLDLRSPAPNSL